MQYFIGFKEKSCTAFCKTNAIEAKKKMCYNEVVFENIFLACGEITVREVVLIWIKTDND